MKILFEGVRFKARFEGREGRAVTESERKRITDLCSREAKATTIMLFSFDGGDANSYIIRRKAQRPRMENRSGQVQPGTERQCQ